MRFRWGCAGQEKHQELVKKYDDSEEAITTLQTIGQVRLFPKHTRLAQLVLAPVSCNAFQLGKAVTHIHTLSLSLPLSGLSLDYWRGPEAAG